MFLVSRSLVFCDVIAGRCGQAELALLGNCRQVSGKIFAAYSHVGFTDVQTGFLKRLNRKHVIVLGFFLCYHCVW